MTDTSAGPQPGAVLSDGTRVEDPLVAANMLLRAVRICASKAAGEHRAAEAKDYGLAALQFAQAIITLDPTRLAGGDTPQARAAATPQQPAKPPVKDGNRNGVIGA